MQEIVAIYLLRNMELKSCEIPVPSLLERGWGEVLIPALVFHGVIVVNLLCSYFLLVKENKNLTCTAYHYATLIMQLVSHHVLVRSFRTLPK